MPPFPSAGRVGGEDFDAANPIYADKVPFFDAVKSAWHLNWDVNRLGARSSEFNQAQLDRQDQITKRTGVTLPLSQTLLDAGGHYLSQTDPAYSSEADAALISKGVTDADYERRVEALRAQFPQAMQGVESADQISQRLTSKWNAIAGRADVGGRDHPVAAWLGGAGASLADPVNIGFLGVPGGAEGGSLVSRMVLQGALQGGLVAGQAPFKHEEAAQYGGPQYGLREGLTDTAGAAVGGAVLEGGFGLLRAGLGRLWPKASAGADPALVRGGQAAADAVDRDHAAVGPDRPAQDFATAEAALQREELKPPTTPVDRDVTSLFANGEAAEIYQGRPIYQGSFTPKELDVAPRTFQYKAEADDAGVTARLRGVEQWDPTASGKVIVFETAEGRRLIADGHQRLGLARRLDTEGFDPRLDAMVFREADGWSARDVRTVAALKNIREGSGSILDAAKVFRDEPSALTDRSLPVSGEFIAQARGLARLSPEAFGSVINKVIPERQAAEIGALAPAREDLHAGMVDLLAKAKPASLDETRALVTEALQDDWIKTQGDTADLFGYDPSVSAMIARAKVAAGVMSELRRNQRIYAGLVKHADAIEAGGNTLARDANEAALALDRSLLEVTAKMSLRSGPLGEAMAAAAKDVTGGGSVAKAVKGVVGRLKTMAEAGEHLDALRGVTLDPEKPSLLASEAAAEFDDPAGKGVEAQVQPKPEEAAIETESGDIFADLDKALKIGPEAEALTRLAPCAPGGAA